MLLEALHQLLHNLEAQVADLQLASLEEFIGPFNLSQEKETTCSAQLKGTVPSSDSALLMVF